MQRMCSCEMYIWDAITFEQKRIKTTVSNYLSTLKEAATLLNHIYSSTEVHKVNVSFKKQFQSKLIPRHLCPKDNVNKCTTSLSEWWRIWTLICQLVSHSIRTKRGGKVPNHTQFY